jgi:molybdopterin molybdotransferase
MVSVARIAAPVATVEEARERLLAGLTRTPAELVPLVETLGRVIADDVTALTDLPGTDNSAMDGYAITALDIAGATPRSPVQLVVGSESRAGYPPAIHRPLTATIIATGAPLPSGADAVVPIEEAERSGDLVRFRSDVAPGRHIRRRGEDAIAGMALVPSGRRLRSVDVGLCAAAGVARVRVARRPRVALLSGGDELVEPGTTPEPHQLTDVNTTMLTAAVGEAGGVVASAERFHDERAAVISALRDARDSADLIVSSAGVSMGAHDHVRDCVAELGSVDLWQVAMRPGRPLVLGHVGGTPFIGLPGNPVSAAVTFLLFARVAILAMQGAHHVLPCTVPVMLGESFAKPAHLEAYLRVSLRHESAGLVATSSGGQGSAMMRGLGDADALLVLPAGDSVFSAGLAATALLLS